MKKISLMVFFLVLLIACQGDPLERLPEDYQAYHVMPMHDKAAEVLHPHRLVTPERIVTSYAYFSNDDIEVIVDFYNQLFADQGWEIVAESHRETRSTMRVEKGNFDVYIRILPEHPDSGYQRSVIVEVNEEHEITE